MKIFALESFPDRRNFTSTVPLCEVCAKDYDVRRRCGVEMAMTIRELGPDARGCNQCDNTPETPCP